MTAKPLAIGLLTALSLCAAPIAQSARSQSGRDGVLGPSAITGIASSAQHCVSGDAPNVHGLGWVESGTPYTITFESDITLTTAVARLDLAGDRSASAFGSPELPEHKHSDISRDTKGHQRSPSVSSILIFVML